MATLEITRPQGTASATAWPAAVRSTRRSIIVDIEVDPSPVVRLSAHAIEALRDAADDEIYGLGEEITAIWSTRAAKGAGYSPADVEAKATRLSVAARALAATENGTIRASNIAPLLGRIRTGHSAWRDLAHDDQDEPLYKRLVAGYEQLIEIAAPGGSSVCGGVLELRTVAERETLELLAECGLYRLTDMSFGQLDYGTSVEDVEAFAARITAFARVQRLAMAGTGTVDASMMRELRIYREERVERLAQDMQTAERYELGSQQRENAEDDAAGSRELLAAADALLERLGDEVA
jgi:hypothetical protein